MVGFSALIQGSIKSFAIFGNVKYNLAVLDAFVEVMKVRNHT